MSQMNFDINQQVTRDKHIVADPNYNNLVLCKITGVLYEEDLKEDTSTDYEYTGKAVPRIIINFEQIHKDGVKRVLNLVEQAAVSIKNTGELVDVKTKAGIYTGQFSRIKHIFDAFVGNVPNINMDVKLPSMDINKTGDEHLAEVGAFYKALTQLFYDKDGNAIFTDKKLILKAILNKDAKKISIPAYVNEGFIEFAKFDNAGMLQTSLVFNANESVVYKATVPTTPNSMGGAPAISENVLNNL